MRILISVLTLFLLTAPGLFAQSSIELTHEGTASFVQARGSIDTIIFVDLFGSSEPEAVLLDDSGVQVYALFFIPSLIKGISIGSTLKKLAVSDVNSDGAADIVCLWRTASYPSVYQVAYWDNASGFADSDTVQFSATTAGFWYTERPPLLTSVDLDDNGNRDLVISYDSTFCVPSICNAEWMIGATHAFSDFWTSELRSFDRPLHAIRTVDVPGFGPVHISESRSISTWYGLGDDFAYVSSHMECWYGADSIVELLEEDVPPELICDSGSVYFTPEKETRRQVQASGQLTGDPGTVEMVSIRQDSAHCVYYDYVSEEYSFSHPMYQTLTLHRFTPGQPLQELWTMDITGEDWHDFVYLPDFPGYFFAFVDGEFRQFRGGDGSLFQASGDVPEGDLHWAKPFADSLYRLIAVDSNVVNFYRPDIVTSANDQPHVSLPESFVLSAPYPNPFNPTVSFSISLPRQTELTIAIYNTLGQQVATVFEGTLPAGERPFIWDGSTHASGVYFIKAITDSATQTQKAVLVK